MIEHVYEQHIPQVNVWNQSSKSIDTDCVVLWVKEIFKVLDQKQVKLPPSVQFVTVVFKNTHEVQALNHRFRCKNRPTDVLSFDSIESTSLGEIVLATQVLEKQAREHQHSFLHEAGYLILHGILHLLGYEHESGGPAEEEMMSLQDTVFEEIKQNEQI